MTVKLRSSSATCFYAFILPPLASYRGIYGNYHVLRGVLELKGKVGLIDPVYGFERRYDIACLVILDA
jgi:hypothetical protein